MKAVSGDQPSGWSPPHCAVTEELIRAEEGTCPSMTMNMMNRTVRCLKGGCDAWAQGFDHWMGGVVDRSTHLELLAERMAFRCHVEHPDWDCPHPRGGIVKGG